MATRQDEHTKDSSSGVSEPDSEVKLWGPVIALIIAILVIPIVWLLIARWLGGSIVLTGDASGLLATIGGVMGAIFTVGGLVIALVAILTQISLQDRVRRVTKNAKLKFEAVTQHATQEFEGATQNAKREFEESTQHAKQELEQKYQTDLRPAIIEQARAMLEEKYQTDLRPGMEKQVNQQIRGHLLLLDAEAAMKVLDWGRAEEAVQEALKHYPQVPGARSLLGLRMGEAVLFAFKQEHGVLDTFSWLAGVALRRGIVVQPAPASPPVSKAIEWLEDAIKSGDNPDGQSSAVLALLFGIRTDFEKMMEVVKSLQNAGSPNFSTLKEPDSLIALLNGCKGAPDQQDALQHLLSALGFDLPTPEQVRASFQPSTGSVRWLVMGKQTYWTNQNSLAILPDFPAIVPIEGGGEAKEGEYRGRVQEEGNLGRAYYPFLGGGVTSQLLPADQLSVELDERFIPICQTPSWWIISNSPVR